MPEAKDPREAEVREVRAQLTEGLEICRAVVEDYREALKANQAAAAAAPEESPAPAGEAAETAPDEEAGEA